MKTYSRWYKERVRETAKECGVSIAEVVGDYPPKVWGGGYGILEWLREQATNNSLSAEVVRNFSRLFPYTPAQIHRELVHNCGFNLTADAETELNRLAGVRWSGRHSD